MLILNMLRAGKALLATILLLSFYLFYGHIYFYRDPKSIFYDPSRAFERSYSLQREAEAISFRNNAFISLYGNQSDVPPVRKVGSSPKICATIMTTARSKETGRHPLEVFDSHPSSAWLLMVIAFNH
jgi:hypothetical protein